MATGATSATVRRLGSLVVVAAVALAGGAAYLGLQRTTMWQMVETQAQDWRFRLRGARPPPANVVIAAIDDATLADVGTWPVPRRVLADAVNQLSSAGAGVIGFDLLLVDRDADGDDPALAAAIAAAGNVVLAVAYRDHAANSQSNGATPAKGERDLLAPPPALSANARLGHVNVVVDADGRLRRMLPTIGAGEQRYPALSVQMMRQYAESMSGAPNTSTAHPDAGQARWLDFYGPPGTIPVISLADVLNGSAADVVDGRAVVLGATATGVGDAFATPYAARLNGVEYFATALGNLLEGRFIRRDQTTIAIDTLSVILAIALALAFVRLLPPVPALGLVIAGATGWLVGTQFLFVQQGVWLSAVAPPLALAITAIGALSARLIAMRADQRDSAAGERNLRRYVAPALADDLARQERPDYDGRSQAAAVLFTDIAGFTKISEAIGPKRTATLLQAFHEKVETAVNQNGGVLTTFLGDGAMAVFGLPQPRVDDASRALAAARALVLDIDAWAPLRIGVGVHFGPVTIAQLGGRSQRQLTATGDTVNVASRLESLTRNHDALIAVSTGVVEAVRSGGRQDLLAGLHHVAQEHVKGRREPVDVWILPARADDSRGAA